VGKVTVGQQNSEAIEIYDEDHGRSSDHPGLRAASGRRREAEGLASGADGGGGPHAALSR
jgi:hypothetical protein